MATTPAALYQVPIEPSLPGLQWDIEPETVGPNYPFSRTQPRDGTGGRLEGRVG